MKREAMELDEKTTKSYATKENLEKALEKLNFSEFRRLYVKTENGRWTAIFPFSEIKDGNVSKFARQGFMVIG